MLHDYKLIFSDENTLLRQFLALVIIDFPLLYIPARCPAGDPRKKIIISVSLIIVKSHHIRVTPLLRRKKSLKVSLRWPGCPKMFL